MSDIARCGLCGNQMPAGEEMFRYHGYSGDCPGPPKARPIVDATQEAIRSSIKAGAPGLSDLIVDAIARSAMLKLAHIKKED